MTEINAFDVLSDRGFVKQCTDEESLSKLMGEKNLTVYCGYDPTADSLHVGHLFTVKALKHLEDAGHRIIILLGGGTAMVGDPTGKSEMRQMLTRERINAHCERFKEQVGRFLDVEGGKTLVVNNADWLLELNYLDFLRDIGRHFSVNRMLTAEAYKQRLERGLSFIEFNYQLLQAYDFLELNRKYECQLQLGGDDQWSNILAGLELCRRLEKEQVYGLTTPLLTTATGEKMGKTVGGALWLEADKLKPYDFYQYWVNVHDDDVVKLLGFYTFLPMDEIRKVAGVEGRDLNNAKSILAYEVTKWVHGKAAACEAHQAALAAFGGRAIVETLLPSSDLPRDAGSSVSKIPTTTIEFSKEFGLLEVLVMTKLAGSKSEARRLIQQGGIRVNDEKISDVYFKLLSEHFVSGVATLRAGKKKIHRLNCGNEHGGGDQD